MKDGNCHDNVKGTTVEVKGKTFKDGLLLFFKMHINIKLILLLRNSYKQNTGIEKFGLKDVSRVSGKEYNSACGVPAWPVS